MITTSGHSPGTLETTASEIQPLAPSETLDNKPAMNVSSQPHVIIEPSGHWSALNWRELWHYRELLYFLTWRDIKVRYKQTVLGVGWVIVQPLLSTVIFTLFLGRLAQVPSDGLPYALFVFSGLAFWTFFSSAVVQSGNSLVGSAHLITKVYFPRLVIPAAAVAARLMDFFIAVLILAGLMVYYQVPIHRGMLLAPVIVSLGALLAVAVGMWTSAVNVKYRDVGVALPVLIQLWMFASPVVYPASLVPERWRMIYSLNPLVGVLENLRAALFGRPLDFRSLAISVIFTFGLLIYSALMFRRMEKGFADIV